MIRNDDGSLDDHGFINNYFQRKAVVYHHLVIFKNIVHII